MDEMLFSGKYKDWEYSTRFDLDKAIDSDVAFALTYMHEKIENRAFCHSGIDCSLIERSVPEGNGIQDMIAFLETKKPGEWKAFLLKAAGKEELITVAESKFICTLLSRNKVSAKITPDMAHSSLKPGKQDILEGQIAFIARYKDWISIKKMGVNEKTMDYEVAGILASINSTIVNKAFDFMHPDAGMRELADAATRGKRKSFINLAEALKHIAPNLTGNKINDAYLLKCVYENLGFAPYVNVDVLVPAYPDLKAPKPRGRFAKK